MYIYIYNTKIVSTYIQVTELVDVLNGLFSCIDFAAKCIGNVWKVETIGDCYIAVVGGPQVRICRVLQSVAGCCRVLQGVAVSCTVLQCVDRDDW